MNAELKGRDIPIKSTGCVMVQIRTGVWLCRTHADDTWEAALALGAQMPCRIPIGEAAKIKLAKVRSISAFTACALVQDPDLSASLVTALLDNKEMPAIALRVLDLHRPQWAHGIAEHGNCPPDLLARYARSGESVLLRQAVGSHPNTPPDVLEYLAQHDRAAVRREVASNPHAPPQTLESLLTDEDKTVRTVARRRLSHQQAAPEGEHSGAPSNLAR